MTDDEAFAAFLQTYNDPSLSSRMITALHLAFERGIALEYARRENSQVESAEADAVFTRIDRSSNTTYEEDFRIFFDAGRDFGRREAIPVPQIWAYTSAEDVAQDFGTAEISSIVLAAGRSLTDFRSLPLSNQDQARLYYENPWQNMGSAPRDGTRIELCPKFNNDAGVCGLAHYDRYIWHVDFPNGEFVHFNQERMDHLYMWRHIVEEVVPVASQAEAERLLEWHSFLIEELSRLPTPIVETPAREWRSIACAPQDGTIIEFRVIFDDGTRGSPALARRIREGWHWYPSDVWIAMDARVLQHYEWRPVQSVALQQPAPILQNTEWRSFDSAPRDRAIEVRRRIERRTYAAVWLSQRNVWSIMESEVEFIQYQHATMCEFYEWRHEERNSSVQTPVTPKSEVRKPGRRLRF